MAVSRGARGDCLLTSSEAENTLRQLGASRVGEAVSGISSAARRVVGECSAAGVGEGSGRSDVLCSRRGERCRGEGSTCGGWSRLECEWWGRQVCVWPGSGVAAAWQRLGSCLAAARQQLGGGARGVGGAVGRGGGSGSRKRREEDRKRARLGHSRPDKRAHTDMRRAGLSTGTTRERAGGLQVGTCARGQTPDPHGHEKSTEGGERHLTRGPTLSRGQTVVSSGSQVRATVQCVRRCTCSVVHEGTWLTHASRTQSSTPSAVESVPAVEPAAVKSTDTGHGDNGSG